LVAPIPIPGPVSGFPLLSLTVPRLAPGNAMP
jgi:hypothetical protein